MSDPAKAVFLSYGHDDACAARRIAEALRASGIEVWFDENELRGGDSWDAKIRKQIDDCSLFIPIISQHTQDRSKGYFRLEWKLAVDQTHLMLAGVPFLAPIVIDDTLESAAAVPAEFMKVQWTRMPGGLPTPDFVAQVKKLLGGKETVGTASRRDPTEPSRHKAAPTTRPSWLVPLAAVVLAVVGYFVWQGTRPVTPATAASSATNIPARPELVERAASSDKSIAVLPFENRSEDKANVFFTDGIHEDILTQLSRLSELRVVSRTSVMGYRGTTKNVREIGKELGVTWLLEGSVQRAGNKVRVTGQLINARTDEHVWAQSYDRDLTDIFAIQSTLALEIATALKATLSPEEKSQLARRPTENVAAYDLLLKAREGIRNTADTRREFEAQIALLQSATALDPSFAEAWGELASLHAQMMFNFYDVSAARLAMARAAIETAQRLAPDNYAVIGSAGAYYYYGVRDYDRALEQFGRFTRQFPNDYIGVFMTGLVQRRQGKWVESLANLRRAAQFDPASPDTARNLMISLRAMRRFDEAIFEQTRRVRLLPESLRESYLLALLHFQARGSTKEVDELLSGPIAARAEPSVAAGFRKIWALAKGDLTTAARLEREFPDAWGGGITYTRSTQWNSAILSVALGEDAAARKRAAEVVPEVRQRLAGESANPAVWADLAVMESVLGHKDEALAAARKAIELLPETRDAWSAAAFQHSLVVALAWTGEKEAACEELRRLFAKPSNANVHELRNSPVLLPLKGYPAFEAILADPKNNQPLF